MYETPSIRFIYFNPCDILNTSDSITDDIFDNGKGDNATDDDEL